MKFVWTKSKMLGGKQDLITWGLNEPCSHFAIILNNSYAFHSSLSGTKFVAVDKLYRCRKKVFEIDFPLSQIQEDMVESHLENLKQFKYDFTFFFWLIWRGILLKLFNKPVPEIVKYQDKNSLLCNEAIRVLPQDIKTLLGLRLYKESTPYKLYKAIKRGN